MKRSIVFEGRTKDGRPYVIRYPQRGDAQMMTDYINEVSKEQTFIRFQGEEMSLKDETKYLQGQLKKIQKKQSVELFVLCDNKIVGISAIDMKDKVEHHEGVFGISLAKEYRGQGLGRILMKLVLEEAEKQLPDLRIITLGCFEGNTQALDMYKKFGFQEYGRLPGGVFYKGKYIDHIYMVKNIR